MSSPPTLPAATGAPAFTQPLTTAPVAQVGIPPAPTHAGIPYAALNAPALPSGFGGMGLYAGQGGSCGACAPAAPAAAVFPYGIVSGSTQPLPPFATTNFGPPAGWTPIPANAIAYSQFAGGAVSGGPAFWASPTNQGLLPQVGSASIPSLPFGSYGSAYSPVSAPAPYAYPAAAGALTLPGAYDLPLEAYGAGSITNGGMYTVPFSDYVRPRLLGTSALAPSSYPVGFSSRLGASYGAGCGCASVLPLQSPCAAPSPCALPYAPPPSPCEVPAPVCAPVARPCYRPRVRRVCRPRSPCSAGSCGMSACGTGTCGLGSGLGLAGATMYSGYAPRSGFYSGLDTYSPTLGLSSGLGGFGGLGAYPSSLDLSGSAGLGGYSPIRPLSTYNSLGSYPRGNLKYARWIQ